MVEQLPFKQLVAGSSPAGRTIIIKTPIIIGVLIIIFRETHIVYKK